MVYRGGFLYVVPLEGVPRQDEEHLLPLVEDPRRVVPDDSGQDGLWQTASVFSTVKYRGSEERCQC